MQTTVLDLLRNKGGVVNSVRANHSVFEVVQKFIEHNIGAVLVMNGTEFVGIVSERDVARNVVLESKTERETAVSEIMSSDVVWVRPDATIEECMALMTNKRVRHLPVMEASRVIGIVSIGDLVNSLISEKQSLSRNSKATSPGVSDAAVCRKVNWKSRRFDCARNAAGSTASAS